MESMSSAVSWSFSSKRSISSSIELAAVIT
jgi:hypothetical protein